MSEANHLNLPWATKKKNVANVKSSSYKKERAIHCTYNRFISVYTEVCSVESIF